MEKQSQSRLVLEFQTRREGDLAIWDFFLSFKKYKRLNFDRKMIKQKMRRIYGDLNRKQGGYTKISGPIYLQKEEKKTLKSH